MATQGPQWTQQFKEPIAQNPWQPKDHNAHNSLENPSPKTRGNPRTTIQQEQIRSIEVVEVDVLKIFEVDPV